MRGKRSKQYRKLMQKYGLHFGFRVPYQVLLDAAILQAAKGFKMDFITGLKKVLHGDVKPMITQCCIRHLYDAENKDDELIEHAKAFERRRCGHHELEKPLSTLECLSSVVDPKSSGTNKNCYVVASQDESVRSAMRQIPGVPLIYVKRSVMIMEPMAGATEKVREKAEREKFRSGLKGSRGTPAAKRGREDDEEDNAEASGVADDLAGNIDGGDAVKTLEDSQPAKKKRKKGPSGPNPMSVKKKKKAPVEPPAKKSTEAPTVTSETTVTEQPASTATDVAEAVPKKKRARKHKSATKDSIAQDNNPTLANSP